MAKQTLSATATSKRAKQHQIAVEAPAARAVAVTGSFCEWHPEGHPLQHNGHGLWQAALALPPGRYEYRLIIDGEWQDDPACGERVPNPFGTDNCVFKI